jgi:hypothetical protein
MVFEQSPQVEKEEMKMANLTQRIQNSREAKLLGYLECQVWRLRRSDLRRQNRLDENLD